MAEPLKVAVAFLLATTCAACGMRPKALPPPANAASAPSLAGATVMVFPVQEGMVPSPDAKAVHLPVDRGALDTEIAYWLEQAGAKAKWIPPAQIDRALARSPGLAIDPRALAVGRFQVAQVKRIGDPLFGDLRRLAAVLNAQLAVIPVAAEYVGATPATSSLSIATAVIDALDGTVVWFGVIAAAEKGPGQASIAGAAQAFARAFGEKKRDGEN